MKFSMLTAVVAIVGALAAPAAAATLVNPSFETGDTSGWHSGGSGSVAVVDTAVDAIQLIAPFAATDGTFFAQLTAGPSDDYTTLSQTFTLTGQSSVAFDAAFLAFDETSDGEGFDDDAYVRIIGAGGGVLFQSDVNAVGDLGHTDWTHVSQLLGAGTYTIEAGVRNVGDDLSQGDPAPLFSSKLLFDDVSVSAAAIPEPETWALMIAGFAGLGGVLRARRSARLQGA